jgi:alkaline phosphatase
MRLSRVKAVLGLGFAAALAFTTVSAQEEAFPVLILPVNQAQFLPGAEFDFRVEVHTRTLPENFSVTVNGTPAAEFFGVEPTEEDWEFGGSVARFNADGVPGEDFDIAALAGDYYLRDNPVATISAADDGLTWTADGETATLEATDNPLVYTIAGGPADGQTLTFGLNMDGAVTGYTIGEATFGLLSRLPTQSSSVIWRELTAPATGEYVVEVTAGGTTQSVTWVVREPNGARTAQNVILFVADGMTVPMISAARVASQGITEGRIGGSFAMDGADAIGLAHTNSLDTIMADSANTASALNTGHIGRVNATGSYSDTSPSRLDDPRVETLASMLRRTYGMAVGFVTTSDFTDATPAAGWAHGRDRATATRANYAIQAFDFQPDVLLGGGGQFMIPSSAEGSARSDDRDLFAEFEEAGYTIATSATELSDALGGDALPERLVGIFHPRDLNVWLDRNVYTDNLGAFTDQPGLVDMTMAAIEVLAQNENGFYLTVEAASVDKQIHPLDQERALSDLIEFDQAVGAAIAWAQENAPDTLIVVTADHGHGYEVYGTVDVATFNAGTTDIERREGIQVYADAGFPTYSDPDGDGFPDWNADVVFAGTVNNGPEHTEDFQVSEVPRVPAINQDGTYIDNPDDDPNGIFISGTLAPGASTGVHTMQDVPVFAFGPGAEAFMGVYHQSEVFFGMAAALGLNPGAGE